MDPLTHVLTGATVAWVATGSRIGRRSLLIGATAALLPDADVFIRSAADPLLAIEHHRGFTHSLAFVPVGGLAAALPFLRRGSRWWMVLAGIVAYASHALLDAATTYGTQLFWPFSRHRVGLDVISIIDPLFTLIVLFGTIAAFTSRRRIAVSALVIAIGWLAAGYVQRERASAAQTRLALARGHRVERAAVFPTFGNTIVWRSVYLTGATIQMDRIRTMWLSDPTYAAVTAVPLVTMNGSRDFDRFAWFSDGWVARAPSDPAVIGDARYSLRTDAYDPVWGIRLDRGRTEWIDRTRRRDVAVARLWDEIRGRAAAYRSLPARDVPP